MRITEKSKSWWDEELSDQLKITRDTRRGKGSNRSLDQAARIKRWKIEKDRMRTLVREKKKECWQRFYEQNEEKDWWEIVKWAKDLWHLKATMGDLIDTAGVPLKIDNEKKNGLIRDHFGWRNEGRTVDEIEEERERYSRLTGINQEKMEELVRKALAGMSNKSAPGSDGIGYKLIKRVLDLKLGSELIREVVENLINRRIPKKWQHSKVVMIPKPGKDYSKTKGWRPINLFNCIGILGEKVVADRPQESGLLHRHQFGSVKGRSATEAVLRVVTRAQRCMAVEGAVGWNFWDVKGGFQNVREEDVIRELEKSEEGKKWIPWVKEFFQAREFELEWDRKVGGKGKMNIGAPLRSPLSLVIFLIWMAPIITKIEEALKNR